jgi:hypothetical protein
MILTRRSFCGLLAALPWVGKYWGAPSAASVHLNWFPVVDRVADKETGISMRFVREFDVVVDQNPVRMDGFICDDGQMRFYVSRDGGQTWELNRPARNTLS